MKGFVYTTRYRTGNKKVTFRDIAYVSDTMEIFTTLITNYPILLELDKGYNVRYNDDSHKAGMDQIHVLK